MSRNPLDSRDMSVICMTGAMSILDVPLQDKRLNPCASSRHDPFYIASSSTFNEYVPFFVKIDTLYLPTDSSLAHFILLVRRNSGLHIQYQALLRHSHVVLLRNDDYLLGTLTFAMAD